MADKFLNAAGLSLVKGYIDGIAGSNAQLIDIKAMAMGISLYDSEVTEVFESAFTPQYALLNMAAGGGTITLSGNIPNATLANGTITDGKISGWMYPTSGINDTQPSIYQARSWAGASYGFISNATATGTIKNGTITNGDLTLTGTMTGSEGGDIPIRFYGNSIGSLITGVDFPNAVIVGANAFSHCSRLKHASFASCVAINSSAFQSCSLLSDISAPMITAIYSNAFQGTNFSSASFQSVSVLGGYAYAECSELITASFPSITTLGAYTFASCINLNEIYAPNVTTIGSRCFLQCSSLTSVNFPSVISIYSGAFISCNKLNSVSFPKAKTIAQYAFYSCTSLTELNFPSATAIGSSAFRGCTNLSIINAPNVTGTLSQHAFHGCNLFSVSFPLVKSVGTSVFAGCENLSDVCLGLASMSLTSELLYDMYGTSDIKGRIEFVNLLSVESSTFYGLSNVTALSMPACSTATIVLGSICTNLSELCLGKTSITSIFLSSLFETSSYSKSHVRGTYIMPHVKSIGQSAFYRCSNLSSVSFPECLSIGMYAFGYCSNLSSISFPKCTSIRSYAFYGCSNLSSVYLSLLSIPDPNYSTYAYTIFSSCPSLTDATIHGGVGYLFSGNQYLQRATIVSSSIASFTFYNCPKLSSIIGNNIVSIYYEAFGVCSSLTSVNFPKCTSVFSYVFYQCYSLASVYLDKCVYISNYAFCSCRNLISLYLRSVSAVTTLGTSVFYSTPIGGYSASAGRFGSVFVPQSLLASFQTATNWASISSRIVGV